MSIFEIESLLFSELRIEIIRKISNRSSNFI